MKINNYGEIIYGEADICNMIMQGQDVLRLRDLVIGADVNVEQLASLLEDPAALLTWALPENSNRSVTEFDAEQQSNWMMPDEYKNLDIAEYILGLCTTPEQLQRVGTELIMFQEKNLFSLLQYLKYLVDVMRNNNVIWGVGRGSSVASYVLYLLGVHRIDSLYYDLNPAEFLR